MTFRTLLMVLLALIVALGYVVILTDLLQPPAAAPHWEPSALPALRGPGLR